MDVTRHTDAEYEKDHGSKKERASRGSILRDRTQDRRARLWLHGLLTVGAAAVWLGLAQALGSAVLAAVVVGILALIFWVASTFWIYRQLERIPGGLWIQAGSLLLACIISIFVLAFSAPPVSYVVGVGMIAAVSVSWLFLPIHIVPMRPGEVYYYSRFRSSKRRFANRRDYTLESFRSVTIGQKDLDALKGAGIDEELITLLVERGQTERHIQRLQEIIHDCPDTAKRAEAEAVLERLLANFPDVQYHICTPLDECCLIWNTNEELSVKISVTDALTLGPPINASLDCACRFFPRQMHAAFDPMVEKWRSPEDASAFLTAFMQDSASIVLRAMLGKMEYEAAERIGVDSTAFKGRFLEEMEWTKSLSGIHVMPFMLQPDARIDPVIADAKLARQAAKDKTEIEVDRFIRLLGTYPNLEKVPPDIRALLPALFNEHLKNYYMNISMQNRAQQDDTSPLVDNAIPHRRPPVLNDLGKLLKLPDDEDTHLN